MKIDNNHSYRTIFRKPLMILAFVFLMIGGLLLPLIFPCTLTDQAAYAESSEGMTMKVSFICEDFQHVGNEWYGLFSLDGDLTFLSAMTDAVFELCITGDGQYTFCEIDNGSVFSQDTVKITVGQTLTITTVIAEYDQYSDFGYDQKTVYITDANINNGFSVSQEICVSEGHGRYSGCEAIWTITYAFIP